MAQKLFGSLRSIAGGGGQLTGSFGGIGVSSLTGVRELDRKLRALPERVSRRVLVAALRAVGKRPRALMRKKIREDHEDSGTLRKSIGTVLRRYPSGNAVLVVGPRKDFRASNDERADKYAIGIERGWRGREPDPFMRQTFEEIKPHVVSDFRAAVGNKIEKEAARSQ